MNKHTLLILSFSLVFSSCFADALVLTSESKWQCTAMDSDDKQWVAHSEYERTATNKAFESCKKESRVPQSCKVAKEQCEAFIKGLSIKPMWQCLALDHMAKHWLSAIYSKRDDAALGAKAYCQQHSGMPESCYVNLLTCKNKNHKP